MSPTVAVTITKVTLRRGLLDLLALHSKATEEAWVLPTERNVLQMKVHHLKARAAGDLLNAINWVQRDLVRVYQLDVAAHGWAATTALKLLIKREHFAAWDYAEHDDAEAAGEAGGHRVNAERDLGLIEEACERAGLIIAEPEVRP
jgi:hypothetical protein